MISTVSVPSASSPGGILYTATFDGEDADGTLTVDITDHPSGTQTFGVVFRYTNNDNAWVVFYKDSSSDTF